MLIFSWYRYPIANADRISSANCKCKTSINIEKFADTKRRLIYVIEMLTVSSFLLFSSFFKRLQQSIRSMQYEYFYYIGKYMHGKLIARFSRPFTIWFIWKLKYCGNIWHTRTVCELRKRTRRRMILARVSASAAANRFSRTLRKINRVRAVHSRFAFAA